MIAIASDHAGFELKEILKQEIASMGYGCEDLGAKSAQVPVDYPDSADALAARMKQHPETIGVLICGSGIGISIAANRHRHLRAALCYNGLAAQLARKHNNANVLCLGARTMGPDMAKFCLEQFLNTSFEGGRHEARVKKLG